MFFLVYPWWYMDEKAIWEIPIYLNSIFLLVLLARHFYLCVNNTFPSRMQDKITLFVFMLENCKIIYKNIQNFKFVSPEIGFLSWTLHHFMLYPTRNSLISFLHVLLQQSRIMLFKNSCQSTIYHQGYTRILTQKCSFYAFLIHI